MAGGAAGNSGLIPPIGTPISVIPQAAAMEEFKRLHAELAALSSLDAEQFSEQTHVPFASLGSYAPSDAPGMDLVQKSALALNASELAALGQQGFVVSARQKFPSFMYGYQTIYAQDLPLYVSADSILYAVHKSYDAILAELESTKLSPSLQELLTSMSAALPQALVSDELRSELDLYLTTARSLLAGSPLAPHDAALAARAAHLYEAATNAAGSERVTLFGSQRDVDFSQFKPRGHYAGSPAREHYFRAMIWLGRLDLRLIDIAEDGSPLFQRREVEAMVALRNLMSDAARSQWDEMDRVIGAFVGEHDEMTPKQVDGLLRDLGVSSVADLANIPDSRLAQTLIDGGYGAQRIASQIAINGGVVPTLPLSRSFALFGQRYVFDSHVFSNVVYDRVVPPRGAQARMLPNPLDVAYAALANDQAGMLLNVELTKYGYAPNLQGMRVLADEHGSDFWQQNLYNLWLSALRSLSPSANVVAKPAEQGLPSVAGTEAWGRRLLNTQLASWAELRHDTLLYAKQSYTAGASCEFPAAYVDPYPEFFKALLAFAEQGQALSEEPSLNGYFVRLAEIITILRDMAGDERNGKPLTAEHLAFINRAVKLNPGCGGPPSPSGWYNELFFYGANSVESDPTVADVHTQPTDELGNEVGRVLHVATGIPQLMVVSVDSCTGSHAYVGLASSYYEQITEHYERLTDADWATTVMGNAPPGPPSWLPAAFVR